MSKHLTDTSTFQALEKDAYHAFWEWPLFLIRKIKQLEQHLAACAPASQPPAKPTAPMQKGTP
ncbi:hypothetical protein HC928_03525 [bacterium]|nr:hypothetical protein [bacterium]